MTASSARKSSASDALQTPAAGDLHVWLCPRKALPGSGEFLRDVLSRYTARAPADLQFSRGPNGKPALAYPPHRLAFNLSGSGEWLALVISGGAAVGIDIEYCDPRREVLKLAARYFSPSELADLQACDGLQLDRFHDYWTLKEAHIKAAGGSLARLLEETAFSLSYPAPDTSPAAPGAITALTTAASAQAWYCLLQQPEDYRLAICCHLGPGIDPVLRLFELDGNGAAHARPVQLRAASPGGVKRAAAASR